MERVSGADMKSVPRNGWVVEGGAHVTGKRTALVVTVVLALTLIPTSGAVAAPGLELDPTEGPVGTNVAASGNGFTGSAVEIFLNAISGSPLTEGRISDRAFKLQFRIPSTTYGRHLIIACADRNTSDECRETADAFFTIPKPPTTTTTTPLALEAHRHIAPLRPSNDQS